jgi:hypothetical protein
VGNAFLGANFAQTGGIEVMVHQTDGQQRKFLADVPYAIAGWFALLQQQITGPNTGLGFVPSKVNLVESACCARSSYRPAGNSCHNLAR